ncbi:MAG: glycosyltransferase family 4 protein [Parabacteroides sp.]|nr:glycosyltransferase family 4 protein [Parabacteroides sp.]
MKQVLFIRYRKSDPIDAGGEQGTNTNYDLLCRLAGKENVTVYHIHENTGAKKKKLMQLPSVLWNFLRGYYYGLSPRKVRAIVALARQHTHVFIDRSLFGVIAGALKDDGYPGKVITFFHNVETVYFAAKIGKYRPWKKLVTRCADRNDRYACRYSDVIVALNERDSREIRQRYDRTPDYLTPVVFKDRYRRAAYPAETTRAVPVCLFLGTYFPMNVHGIRWFIDEVLPHVNIRLQIIGKGMSALAPEVSRYPNIELLSDVPDLAPYIEQADFMLLPLFRGSGMKIKTCESLMYGKNILGTTETFEGYEVDFDRVGALCNTREEFIAAIRKYAASPVPRFNAYSRQVFVKKYAEEARLGIFGKILE